MLSMFPERWESQSLHRNRYLMGFDSRLKGLDWLAFAGMPGSMGSEHAVAGAMVRTEMSVAYAPLS